MPLLTGDGGTILNSTATNSTATQLELLQERGVVRCEFLLTTEPQTDPSAAIFSSFFDFALQYLHIDMQVQI